MHSGHHKTLHSTKPTDAKKTENPLRRPANWMTGLGQSLQDPHSLIIGGKPQGDLPGSDCGRVWQGGAEVSSTRRQSPWGNQRQSLWVGAWNVPSRSEDDHLSLLSSELKRLNIGIAALSEIRRPESGAIIAGG